MCVCVCVCNRNLEEVECFTYLGSAIDKSGKASAEVDSRIEKGGRMYQMLHRRVFRNRNQSKTTKMRAFSTIVMSITKGVLN